MNLERPVVFNEESSLVGGVIFLGLAAASVSAGAYFGGWVLFILSGLAATLGFVAYNCVIQTRRIFDGQTYTEEVTCFGWPVSRRQEPIAFYALRQVCFEERETRALLLVDRFRPEALEHLLDGCTTDAEAEAFAAGLGIELVDADWSEEGDPSRGPHPSQLTVSRSPEGLLLVVRVPTWLRWNRRLGLVAGVCFITGLVSETELWREDISAAAFVVLLGVTLVHLLTLYSSRYQYVRDERLLWGDRTVTCSRRREIWRSPLHEIDGVDLMELGEKYSKLPTKTPPSWHEYQVNVTVKDSVVACFRSSDKWLVEWVVAALQAELAGGAAAPKSDDQDGDA